MPKPSEVRGLSIDDTARDAAVKILWARFADMWAFIAPVLKDFDPDAIHDMRVASRRLRTAMQTFRQCFGHGRFRDHYRCITQLADSLGEVRDRDVLIEELERRMEALPEGERFGLQAFIDDLRAELEDHRETLRHLLERLHAEGYDRSYLLDLARGG
jgi:CHAD domain-containing protein